jgi:hypothetical protein
MGNRKITLTVDEDLYRELAEAARPMGFTRVSNLARWLVIKGIHRDSEMTGRKAIEVSVDNYRTLLGYAQEKKLGSVEVFATFAMEQYMSRVPLTEAQKRRVEEKDSAARRRTV